MMEDIGHSRTYTVTLWEFQMKFGMFAAVAAVALVLTGNALAQSVKYEPQPRNKPEQVVATSIGQFTLCSAAGWYPTQCAGLNVPDAGDKQLSGVVRNVIHTPAGTLVKTNPQWDTMGFVVALFETDGQIFMATILNHGSMGAIWRYDAQKGAFDPVLTSGLMLSVNAPHERVWDKSIARMELSYYGGSRDGKSAGYVEYDLVTKTWVERRQ